MSRLKSLLLPLALVLGTITVFEAGTRYGAANMRAYAIASELQFPLRIYVQSNSSIEPPTRELFENFIDLRIGTGALHREVFYLNSRSRKALDQTLAYALSVRGPATAERFAAMDASNEATRIDPAELKKIQEAINKAKTELVDNAPDLKD